jgi:hypothetical protein
MSYPKILENHIKILILNIFIGLKLRLLYDESNIESSSKNILVTCGGERKKGGGKKIAW